jgi:hypothetical protein
MTTILTCSQKPDSRHCGALVANVTLPRISPDDRQNGAKFCTQDLDTLKRKGQGSLLPEEILKNVIFIKYVSKTACLPSPHTAAALSPPLLSWQN